MADKITDDVKNLEISENDETSLNYKAPAKKTLEEIASQDANDESLVKYKQQLLGDMKDIAFDASDPRKVIVVQIEIHSPELTTPKTVKLRESSNTDDFEVTIKEGAEYHIELIYHVQHEIVSGLRYSQKLTRKGIPVGKENVMIGSYAPRKEHYTYKSDEEDAPKGMMARGTYKVNSQFLDDDKHVHAEFQWKIKIDKSW